ncbi:MAG: Hpt domain-containing protein, partial [Candidatus Entotheonellia bacterium]
MTPERDAQADAKIIVHVDAELQELIPGYLDNRLADIHAMQAALVQGDYESIRILGHSMKGSGGGYGFDAITEIGSALEQDAKGRNAEAIRTWVGQLATYLER